MSANLPVITRNSLVNSFAETAFGKQFTKPVIKQAVDEYFRHVNTNLVNLGEVKLLQNGAIIAVTYKKGGRPVRNPRTMEKMTMEDTISVRWYRARKYKSICSFKCNYRDFADRYINFSKTALEVKLRKALLKHIGAFIQDVVDGKARIEIRGSFSLECFERVAKALNPKTMERINEVTVMRNKFKISTQLLEELKQRFL